MKRAIWILFLTTAAFGQELTTMDQRAQTPATLKRGDRVFFWPNSTVKSLANGATPTREGGEIRKRRELVFYWQDGTVRSAVKETIAAQRNPVVRKGDRTFFFR
jgi:hypothetical protein